MFFFVRFREKGEDYFYMLLRMLDRMQKKARRDVSQWNWRLPVVFACFLLVLGVNGRMTKKETAQVSMRVKVSNIVSIQQESLSVLRVFR